jgi:hypothetical protein
MYLGRADETESTPEIPRSAPLMAAAAAAPLFMAPDQPSVGVSSAPHYQSIPHVTPFLTTNLLPPRPLPTD